jgi:hypothetical protein
MLAEPEMYPWQWDYTEKQGRTCCVLYLVIYTPFAAKMVHMQQVVPPSPYL